MAYVSVPIEYDPDALAQRAYDYIQARIPEWEPHDGQFEVWLIEALSHMAAEQGGVASDVPTAIFRWAGATLFDIPPRSATQASAPSTWTFADDAGYTIPAGTVVAVPTAGDTAVTFLVSEEVIVPYGETATLAGAVTLVAEEGGVDGSGLDADPQLVDSDLGGVLSSIELTEPTSGGTDAEEDEAYLGRLRDELGLQSPTPILPYDFVVLARRVPSVYRSVVIDGYDPVEDTDDNEKMIAIASVDVLGAAVSGATKLATKALFELLREANFVCNTFDPTFTIIDSTFAAVALPGWDPADVQARAITAVTDYLRPSNFGAPPQGDTPVWINDTHVRYLEVAEVVNSVPGVHHITSLTIGIQGGDPQDDTDIELTGRAPLPQPGDIEGTVTAP